MAGGRGAGGCEGILSYMPFLCAESTHQDRTRGVAEVSVTAERDPFVCSQQSPLPAFSSGSRPLQTRKCIHSRRHARRSYSHRIHRHCCSVSLSGLRHPPDSSIPCTVWSEVMGHWTLPTRFRPAAWVNDTRHGLNTGINVQCKGGGQLRQGIATLEHVNRCPLRLSSAGQEVFRRAA